MGSALRHHRVYLHFPCQTDRPSFRRSEILRLALKIQVRRKKHHLPIGYFQRSYAISLNNVVDDD
jgi:hypothetical protein